jgi:hypothetical protein
MRRTNFLKYVIAILVFVVGCDDLFEEDLSNSMVLLYAPSDSISINNQNVTFWWDSLRDANEYNLQVVSQSFDAIEFLALDTTLTNTKFIKELPSGNYQWRVKALNSHSEAVSDIWSFTITSE